MTDNCYFPNCFSGRRDYVPDGEPELLLQILDRRGRSKPMHSYHRYRFDQRIVTSRKSRLVQPQLLPLRPGAKPWSCSRHSDRSNRFHEGMLTTRALMPSAFNFS